ncbi:LytR/AlgR family response regulator transcription factor [Flavobacterium sp. W1B]|uniref:LytR/AlgR family response regulator transcription factor n=1 Tax=Flavobacterium sp. W1B TaxID=3394146 RepID=UPI0039BD4878
MRFSFIIIDENNQTTKETLELFENFPNYFCAGIAKDNQSGVNQIIKLKPQLAIVKIPTETNERNMLLETIAELFQYVETIPYLIAVAESSDYALAAMQSGFSDYVVKSLSLHQLGKSLFKFEKRTPPNIVSNICIKSYSDYQFVSLQSIVYLKADNNTTDIKLENNKIVNAYKTLKHFESLLPFYFLRIHKSYIVNINHVSRIHFSKSKCYLNYNEILPFSLNYRDNVDAIIRKINI